MRDTFSIENELDFFVTEFGYDKTILTGFEKSDKIVIVYEHKEYEKRVEAAYSRETDNNHLIFRKIVNGILADYDNDDYCIDINILENILLDKYETNSLLYPFSKTTDFYEYSISIIQKFSKIFKSNDWFNVSRYLELRNDNFKNKFGKDYTGNSKSLEHEFYEECLKRSSQIELLYDSDKRPPYDKERLYYIEFIYNGQLISVNMPDWRDYNEHFVLVDKKISYKIDSFKTDYKKQIVEIINKIDKSCSS